ncbi:DUF2330 domain-containing protein [Melittangium boletus]|uniref:DUF2330 domain-containing protein n=1 Tax=Melittangium boletus DSM 14713 TaxID=1294270 RepID=A0A250IEW4_9BACT|nr:DUF2330 domain-containing protein [Melittangium boletus]ATB30384.1 hypothetical protein MEBOL_003845 [Melittangium boletus DSM 14713]
MRFPLLATGLMAALVNLAAPAAEAFCGFYVGKADTSLFNDASQVVLVRDGERTVVTMSNDYKGELTDFALVVPVPVVLKREQIHVGERRHIERLDAYSAPRLVEYFDRDPCAPVQMEKRMSAMGAAPGAKGGGGGSMDKSLGVTVEAQYTVGEYDILILSATESEGLETWLRESGYKIPPKASKALAPYIKQDMKFFVAKVNLKEQKATGFSYLRPLQMAYESKKFMLPIRLGMANARGPQDLVIYALTRQGRVESSNYRTVKVPSDMDVPVYVKEEFNQFYPALFSKAHEKAEKRALLTEYVWDMGWCDPCAADPLSNEELRALGVYWVNEGDGVRGAMGGVPVTLTRLHARYDGEHFPEDLVFQVTNDKQNFQARYVLRHAFKGEMKCDEGKEYLLQLDKRHRKEAETLAELTGWSLGTITKKMGADAPGKKPAKDQEGSWYQKLWK